MSSPLIGVLGGMGPAATIDFLQKILQETAATRDQDHAPVITWNVPQIPDRQHAIAGRGESPLPAMLKGINVLNAAGAQCIAIPCNTAHYWFRELQVASPAPILHIVDATVNSLVQGGYASGAVGILATRGTLAAGLYQERLAELGIACLTNTDGELDELFIPGCYAVKSGNLDTGGRLLEQAALQLLSRGAAHLILACTEVALALAHVQSNLLALSYDSNKALARACVRHWQQAHAGKARSLGLA